MAATDDVQHCDLIVIGAGSGNMLLGGELAHLRAAIIEQDRFGGTCLNRGCIPSKMLVVTADAAHAVGQGRPVAATSAALPSRTTIGYRNVPLAPRAERGRSRHGRSKR